MTITRWFHASLAAGLLCAPIAPLHAQTPPGAPTTAVLASLTVKAGVERARVMQTMPEEVRETVKLYLDGKIQQWYARGDGRGVVFILNCNTVAEAQALMDALPLAKGNLATFEFTPLSPLTPLRLLLTEPAAAPKGDQR
jgi:hypothetical protein